MRVLVVNSPLMYRQSLVAALRAERTGWDVTLSSPAVLRDEMENLRPDGLICDEDAEESPGVICRVEISVTDHLCAQIFLAREATEIRDLSLEHILAAFDAAESMSLWP